MISGVVLLCTSQQAKPPREDWCPNRARELQALFYSSTRKRMTFVNTTAIACYQNYEAPVDFLPVCNSSCVHKRHGFASKTRKLRLIVYGTSTN